MAKKKKIGNLGTGGIGLATGSGGKKQATLKELFLALRAELDALYAKMDADSGIAETDYAEDLPTFEK